MPSLLEIPDIAMKVILEKSGFESLQNLRKSCRDLRNFIDDVKPESDLRQLYIQQYGLTIRINIIFQSGDRISIEYHNERDQHVVLQSANKEWKQKSFANSNFIDIACRDIQLLLDSKRVLDEVHITSPLHSGRNDRFFNELSKAMESRTHPPKISRLHMYNFDLEQALDILRFVDPKKLESIQIVAGKDASFDISKIANLEQWKSAKTIILSGFQADIPIDNLLHLERIEMDVTELTTDMVLQLKETFLRSPHMRFLQYWYERFASLTQLIELYGGRDNDSNPYEWYFETPRDSVLKISVYLRCIYFGRMSRKDVPRDAIIH